MCATAWLMFVLLLKNVLSLIVLMIQRRNDYIYQASNDARIETTEDWSLAGRIQHMPANDVEYMPYFFVLFLIMFCRVDLVSQENHHYLARVLVYGLLFTIDRYRHTISYLIHHTSDRILGFLITVVISLDHLYYMSVNRRISNLLKQ